MNHKIKVCVQDGDGTKELFTGRKMSLPSRLIRLLFGDCRQILVLKPGESIKGIEVHEEKGNGEK